MATARTVIEKLLAKADVKINGDPSTPLGAGRPWDITVHDERFYARVLGGGSLALGESYMDGWWDSPAIDELIKRVLMADLQKEIISLPLIFNVVRSKLFNRQSRRKAFEVGEEHYDTGNDLFEKMLDKRMVYSCGYWTHMDPSGKDDAKNLDEAQETKLDLVCRKIGLKAGDRVLDIGCGWGSFAKYAAETYGASVVGITVSEEQAKLARERCTGLPVEIRVCDYRELHEEFDHIISIGMFEHVGVKNYDTYFKVVRRCLKDGGLFLLHTIGGNRSVGSGDPFLDKYIFPNGMLPSVAQIARATENRFVIEDWHNFGPDYATTALEWARRFDAAWPNLREKYGDRFYRMWTFYLLMCAGAFKARYTELWQVVLSKNGVPGGYRSVR